MKRVAPRGPQPCRKPAHLHQPASPTQPEPVVLGQTRQTPRARASPASPPAATNTSKASRLTCSPASCRPWWWSCPSWTPLAACPCWKPRAALPPRWTWRKPPRSFSTPTSSSTWRCWEHIEGIDNERDKRWYASVLLNRLMFVWFLQKKGFFLQRFSATTTCREQATNQSNAARKPLLRRVSERPVLRSLCQARGDRSRRPKP
jgi:hypothetical protein